MNALKLLSALMPLLLALVAAVEKVFTKRGSGKEKKQAVKNDLMRLSEAVLPAGSVSQVKMLEELEPLIDVSIDTAAAALYPQTHDSQQ